MIRPFIARARNSVLVRNAAWLFAGQGLSFVVQAFYFIILARMLGTREYGLLAGAVALVNIVGQYSGLGSGLIFMRYVSADHTRFRLYWGNILMSVFLPGSLIVIALRLSGRWVTGPASVPLLFPVAISDCLFQQLASCAGQVFQTFEKMKFSAALNLINSLARFTLAVLLFVFLGKTSAWQWAIASLAVSGVSAAIAVGVVTRHFGLPSFSLPLLFRHAGEGFIFAISGSTTAVYNDIDKVVLTHMGMEQANGVYSMAYRVVNIGAMPITSLVGAAFPRFFRAGTHGVRHTVPLARQLLRRTAVLGVAISAGMFLCAPIIPHLVGPQYVQSVSALRWLCLIPLFRCFNLSAGDALAGAGLQKSRLACQSTAAISNLLLNLYLIPRYSWWGAAWASLITDGGLGILHWLTLLWLSHRAVPVLQAAER